MPVDLRDQAVVPTPLAPGRDHDASGTASTWNAMRADHDRRRRARYVCNVSAITFSPGRDAGNGIDAYRPVVLDAVALGHRDRAQGFAPATVGTAAPCSPGSV